MENHDGSYHTLFSNPVLVADLMRHSIPEELTEPLDIDAMVQINTKFHAEGLERRDSNIIFRILHLQGEGEIY